MYFSLNKQTKKKQHKKPEQLSTTFFSDLSSLTSCGSPKYIKQAKHTVPIVYTELHMMHICLQVVGSGLTKNSSMSKYDSFSQIQHTLLNEGVAR